MLNVGLRALWTPLAGRLSRSRFNLLSTNSISYALAFLFWVFATQTYTAEQIGISAAIVAMLPFLGSFAQINLARILAQRLPEAGSRAGRLILNAYGLATGTALLVSAVVILLIDDVVAQLELLEDIHWVTASFVAAVVAQTLYSLQKGVLAELGLSALLPIRSGLSRISALMLLAPLSVTALSDLGPFAAWAISLFIAFATINVFMFAQLKAGHRTAPASTGPARLHGGITYLDWNRITDLITMSAIVAAPLLALKYGGSQEGASYWVAWLVASSITLLVGALSASLLAETPAESRLQASSVDIFVRTMMILAFAVAIVVAGAPLIMELFGKTYVTQGTAILRLLALASIPWGGVTIYLMVLRARGAALNTSIIQSATLLLLVVAGVLLGRPFGALGMAIAWFAVHSFVALSIAGINAWRLGGDGIIDLLLVAGSSCARIVAELTDLKQDMKLNPEPEPDIQELLRKVPVKGADKWCLLHTVPTQGDVAVHFLGDPRSMKTSEFGDFNPQVAGALLKTSLTPDGAASLDRHIDCLRRLNADQRLTGRDFLLPEILALKREEGRARVVESLLPGEDGRTALKVSAARDSAMSGAMRAIAILHERTSRPVLIDDDWFDKWMVHPARNLQRPVLTLLAEEQRNAALAALEAEQRDFWHGRKIRLGWSHGDYSPGNILFEKFPNRNEGGAGRQTDKPDASVKVGGIIDWDMASPDSPPGFDACHLAITTRSQLTGDGLGRIVRELLLEPVWKPEEERWLAASIHSDCGLNDWPSQPDAVRAMVGLVWLHHVNANMQKSRRFVTSRLWASSSVERVLQVFLQAPGNSRN